MKRRRLFLLNDQTSPRINAELACEIGLNESIILLQFEFWQSISDHFYEDKYWFYNSIPEIRETFRFWSVETIKRTVTSIVKSKFVHTGNFNKSKFDKTTWYSLNFENLSKLQSIRIDGFSDSVKLTPSKENVMISDSVKLTPSVGSICPDRDGQFDPIFNTERSTENTDRLTVQSPISPISAEPEVEKPVGQSVLLNQCKVKNKSVLLVIDNALKTRSTEYVSLQIDYANDKCRDVRGFRKLLDLAIQKNYGQAWKDDQDIEAAKAAKKKAVEERLKAAKDRKADQERLVRTASETALERREAMIADFLKTVSQGDLDGLKTDFIRSANLTVKSRFKKFGFESVMVKVGFDQYLMQIIEKETTLQN